MKIDYKTVSNIPEVGTHWRHSNGALYKVLLIANLQSTKKEYPITVVYEGVVNKLIWSRPLSDWYRSMTTITEKETIK